MENSTNSLKILTYNAWGLKIGPFSLAKDYKERIYSLPTEIYRLNPDIIFLQEVWKKVDRDYILTELKKRGYVYSFHKSDQHPKIRKLKKPFQWLNNLLLGNGLIIISKFKINLLSTKVLTFSNFTANEEFFTRKGAIYCEVNSPKFGNISCINTHLGSVDYNPSKRRFHPKQVDTQTKQLKELENFIQSLTKENPLFIGGDLNIDERNFNYLNWFPTPGKQYVNLLENLKLVDSYRFIHPNEVGKTYASKNIYNLKSKAPEGRIDYLFHSNLHNRLEPKKSSLVFTSPIRKKNNLIQLSDHFGILSEYKIIKKGV